MGLVVALVCVAEPLEGADADGAVEAAGPEGDAVAHVAVQQVTLHLAVAGHVQHVARYVQTDPVAATSFRLIRSTFNFVTTHRFGQVVAYLAFDNLYLEGSTIEATGTSSQIRTKLRDWAVWQARAGCSSQAALSSNDSKTLYIPTKQAQDSEKTQI